jgi:hypothetical protein
MITEGAGPAVFPTAEPKAKSDKSIDEGQYKARESGTQALSGGMISEARDLAEMLVGHVDDLVPRLVRSAMRIGDHWIVGSVTEETGKCLYIRRSGPRAGRWSDAAGSPDDRGDLLELIRRVFDINRREAMDWARAYLDSETQVTCGPGGAS